MTVNEKKHNQLLAKWEENYKETLKEGESFTKDGPSDWQSWDIQNPKILFLLKESYGGFNPANPGDNFPDNTSFWPNIARWYYAVSKLYKNRGIELTYHDRGEIHEILKNFRGEYDKMAFVEVKKLDTGNSRSNNSEINRYAKKDCAFLKKQIDLISPDIIFCCYTINAYDKIYVEEHEYEIFEDKCGWYMHGRRLVIDFWHPSNRRPDNELFDLLCSLIKKGKVFEKFDWAHN